MCNLLGCLEWKIDVEKDAMFRSVQHRSLCGELPVFVTRWQLTMGAAIERPFFAASVV